MTCSWCNAPTTEMSAAWSLKWCSQECCIDEGLAERAMKDLAAINLAPLKHGTSTPNEKYMRVASPCEYRQPCTPDDRDPGCDGCGYRDVKPEGED